MAPTPWLTIPLTLTRFDGVVAPSPAPFSAAVPLPPSTLDLTALRMAHFAIGGVLVPRWLAPLAGRHPNGSPRALLLQGDARLGDRPVTATLSLPQRGSPPASARPPALEAPRPTPSAPDVAGLPTDPAVLCATGLGGPLWPRQMGAGYDPFERDYTTASEAIWAAAGPQAPRGTASYEHVLTAYQAWLRTGDPIAWRRASQMGAAYQAFADRTPGSPPPPWHLNSEGMAVHYWATGDERARTLVGAMAHAMAQQTRDTMGSLVSGYRLGGPRGDDRMRGRALLAMIDATLLEAPHTSWFTATALAKGASDVLGTQHPSGAFGGTDYGGGQKNFMVGILLHALCRYYDEITPDARIPDAIRRATDYLWTTQWVPMAGAFRYVSVDVTGEGANQGKPQPPLNGLILPAFAWMARTTGDAVARQRADAILAGIQSQRALWPRYWEQFDQAFGGTFPYVGWAEARRAV